MREEQINETTMENVEEVIPKTDLKSTMLITGLVGLSVVGGVVTYKKVVKPMVKKIKDIRSKKNNEDEEIEVLVEEK